MIGGYSICLNEWALDKDIKNELNLLLIISSLCAEKGYCFASNEYFAKLFKIDQVSVSRKVKKLEEKGYISITYKKRGAEIIGREIRLTKMLTDDYQKNQPTINKNVKENNISNNNISNNKKKEIYKERKFKKPTLEEVKKYCKERNNNIDANNFIDFYESKGWYVGKNKMKDWKACVRTWERNSKEADLPSWFNEDLDTTQANEDEFDKILKELGG